MEVGLIIFAAEHRTKKRIIYTVFVSKRKPLLYVKGLPSVNPLMMSVEEEQAIEKLKKEQQSIRVGDWIKFDPIRNVRDGVITEYEREKNFVKTRISEGCLQVMDDIVLARKGLGAYRCYSKRFDYVKVDQEMGKRFLENVVFSCWLSVKLHLDGLLEIKVEEFFDVSENQQFAGIAPWNFANPNFRPAWFNEFFGPAVPELTTEENDANVSDLQATTDMVFGLSDDNQMEKSVYGENSTANLGPRNRVLPNVFGVRGLVVENRTVISDYGSIPTLIGYLDPKHSLLPGDVIVYDGLYNQNLGVYVTKSYVVSHNEQKETCETENVIELFNKSEAEKYVLNLPSGFLKSGFHN